MFATRIALATLTAAVTLSPAFADTPIFGDTPYQKATGRVIAELRLDNKPAVPIKTINLKAALDAAWAKVKHDGEAEIKKKLNNKKVGDVSVYDMDPHIGAYTLEAKSVANGIVLKLRATGNYLRFKSTTPDVHVGPFSIGAPRGADPKIHIDFTVEAEVKLTVGADRKMTAQVLSAVVKDVKSHGANFTGWLGHAVADVVKFFGGPDLRGMLRNAVDREVNAKLKPQLPSFQTDLAAKIPAGAHFGGVFFEVRKGDILVIFNVSSKPYVPPVIK